MEQKAENKSKQADTTQQQDITKAGQRKINMLWEVTQSIIAIMVTIAVIYCAIKKVDSPVLNNAFFLVVSMYLVRTNHKLIGGVGDKDTGR